MESEDRKRKYDNIDDADTQPAKKPLQQLSPLGPLTQQDVVYYKKEAIWRQMRFYKLQANEVKRELHRYENRYNLFIASSLLLEGWYTTIVGLLGGETPEKLDLANSSHQASQELLDQRHQTLLHLLKTKIPVSNEELSSKLLDVVKLESEKNKAQALLVDLEDKVLRLEAQISDLQMAKDRFESASIKRVQANNKQKSDEPELQSNGKRNEGEAPETEASSSSSDSTQANGDKKALEDLQIEFQLMKAGMESLTNSLKVANSKLSSLEQENLLLSQKVTNLDEAELMKCAKYVNLLSNNKSLGETNAQLLKLKEELVSRIGDLEEKQGSIVSTVSTEVIDENKHLKELLSKAESDLARVRAVRDELTGKNVILKLELEQSKPASELLTLSETLNLRLLKLEKVLASDFTVESDANLEALEKPELIKRLQILSGELKDLEYAFQEIRNLALDKQKDFAEKDNLVKKLNVEKSKADQKYFASMRAKDLLIAENKILKSQMTKSQELIQKHGEIEKTYTAKIDVLVKSVAELRAMKESSIRENSKLYETVKNLTRSREGAAKELSQCKENLKVLLKEKEVLVEDVADLKYTHGKLQGKLKATESLLQKYKTNNTSSILQEDEKQLEALRSITKCSVCSKNWKNTAITACGHVFCDGCVQERLNARLRRCPTCNKGFSSNDLLSVHL